MALPSSTEARSYYQAAHQRLLDGRFLLEGSRTTAAVYLTGYGVECMLKALILSAVPARRRTNILASFRGSRAHEFEWLLQQYFGLGGARFPPQIARYFTLVDSWTTDVRYKPGTINRREADVFLDAAEKILTWADGRL